MKLKMNARQMTLREGLKELAADKLSRYDRFFDESAEAQVTFSCRHGGEAVEITIHSDGNVFRAEEESDTFRTAFDGAMDSLDRQIRKNKTKLEKRMHEGAFAEMGWENEKEPENAPAIIRKKTFDFKPMSPEEAVLQMELTSHDFYVFTDEATEKTAVVYRRKDGNYGMISQE